MLAGEKDYQFRSSGVISSSNNTLNIKLVITFNARKVLHSHMRLQMNCRAASKTGSLKLESTSDDE